MNKILLVLFLLFFFFGGENSALAVVGHNCLYDNKCDNGEVCATVTKSSTLTETQCYTIESIPDGARLQKTIYPDDTTKSIAQLCSEIPNSTTRFPSSCGPQPSHAPTGLTCSSDQVPTYFGGQIVECRAKLFSATPTPTPTPPLPPCREKTDPVTNKKINVCDTAFGPFQTDPGTFVKQIFGIVLSLAGGISLLLIIISGYRLMASGGNPEKVNAARDQLTSAIIGLIFIIFSFSILQIIGVDILHIPGLR